jgi:hypothetical protein
LIAGPRNTMIRVGQADWTWLAGSITRRPKEPVELFLTGPMTGEAINQAVIAFKEGADRGLA